jgi:hypothetical protein
VDPARKADIIVVVDDKPKRAAPAIATGATLNECNLLPTITTSVNGVSTVEYTRMLTVARVLIRRNRSIQTAVTVPPTAVVRHDEDLTYGCGQPPQASVI